MKQNNESPIGKITQEFADSGTLFYLEAKYLSLVTKAIHDSNYSKALPDRMGCRGKAGKIATELVCRFLNKYGLVLTYDSLSSEYSQKITNRDNGSALIGIAKLNDEANPLHELVQVMKNTERHQYHHPKLVQALMNKVPHLLNDETKSHFNNILSRATVAKNNRDQNNKNGLTATNRSTSLNSSAETSSNQIKAKIQQPVVFLDEGTDDETPGKSKGKQSNIVLSFDLNIKSPTNPNEIATLELSPPLPDPSQVTATAVLLPGGDDYQKISSSNGTNHPFNEEEENVKEQFSPVYQDRNIQNMNYTPNQNQYAQNMNNTPNQNQYAQNMNNMTNQNQGDKEYEYEYEYETEVEQVPNTESNESPKKNKPKAKKEKPKKSQNKKSNKKPKKKNSIDPQIQQQLEQQQLIIQQQLQQQELQKQQLQQQQEQQEKFQQQLQQQELQQQQLQQLLKEQQLQQQELQQQQLQQLLKEQQLQQEQLQQQLKLQQQKSPQQSPTSSQTTGYSTAEESQENSDSGYNDNAALSDENKLDQPKEFSEASMTSVADFIDDDQTDVKKRGMKSVSNALDNLLKNKKAVIEDDSESTVIIPIERKVKPQLLIESFPMPEVPFNDNSQYYSDLTESNEKNSEYSAYSNYSNTNGQDANSEYSNYSNINEKDPNIEDLELENAQERATNIEQIYDNNSINDDNNAINDDDNAINDDNNAINSENNFEENIEQASSQATSVAAKEYPDKVLRSIKDAFSPKKEKEDSFATSKADSFVESQTNSFPPSRADSIPTSKEDSFESKEDYYYSAYYSSEYYTEDDDDRRRKDDQKQVKFKLRINREQFERFYPNQNLSNKQTIKVSKRGLSQLQEIMSQKKDNEPLRQVIRLKTPTLQSPTPFNQSPTPFNQSPTPFNQSPTPFNQSQQPLKSPQKQKPNPNDQSTISVVTKGPHSGLIKRKIKKSDHQADIQKKLKEKTEYAKKLQEELERRKREMEEQAAAAAANNNNNNIQITNKKLAKSQPQTKTNRIIRDRSASPKEIDRPSSAPKKKARNYRKRDIQLYNDFDTINTSSLLPSELSTVSEVHPELMSPKQREQKKKEIRRKIKKLNNELQQRSDPEEKRIKRAKIEAKIQQLREEFERSSDNAERETKRRKINSNIKKLNRLDQNANFNNSPRNNLMTPEQRRKRRNEIKLQLKKLHAEFEMNSNIDQEQNNQSENYNDSRPVIPRRNNNYQMEMDQIPVPQPRPRQPQQIEREININNNVNPPSYSMNNDQSSEYASYNSNSNIETEESYNSQSPIQNQPKLKQIQPPRNREIINNINNNINDKESSNLNLNNNGSSFFNESSSLLERRNYKKMKVDIPTKDGKEAAFKRHNEQENNRRKEDSRISEMDDDAYSNNYNDDREPVSVNSDIMKQPEYKPRKINIKKESNPSTSKSKGSRINDDERKTPQVVDETIVIKDGKKKIKRKIHIPISQNQENSEEIYSEYEEQSGSKKVISKSSSKQNNNQKASLNDFSSEVKIDGGLGKQKQDKEVEILSNPDYSNLDQNFVSNFLLHIKVIEAKGVPRIDSFDPCDPYCLLFVEGQNDDCSRRTKSMVKTSDPVWNEEFDIIVNNERQKHRRRRKNSSQSNQSCILNVHIKDEDLTAGDVLLSSTKIDLNEFQIDKSYDMWFQLQNDANSEENMQKNSAKSTSNTNSSKGTGSTSSKSGGRIHLILEKTALLDEDENDNEDDNGSKSASYSASNSLKNTAKLFESQNGQKIKLHILIDQAEGLSKRNQYIVAKIKNSPEGVMKTMPVNSSEPTWNESFKLKLPSPQNDVLLITLRTKDEKNGDDDIGNISIPISTLTPPNSGQIVDKWYEFRSTSYSSKTRNHRGSHLSSQKMCGKLHLILSTEIDKEDTNSNYESYSNSVTPNASSNNSVFPVSSSLQKLNANPSGLIVKQAPNSSARHLAVQIIEARGLPSHCSPYCIVQIRDEKPILHTRAVRPTPIPKWNQKLDFHSRKAVEDGILDISIKDKRSYKEQEIASLSLSVESLNKAKRAAANKNEDEDDQDFVINKWFPLEPAGEIHLILVPRMKDSPKPTILTPIDNKQADDQYENIRSNDDLPGVQIDASSSDIDIDVDVDFDAKNEKEKNLRKKARKNKKLHIKDRESVESDTENRKKRILEQFPPTTSEEE